MEVDLISESFKFLLLGMATVYVFLILMIYVIKLQEIVLKKLFPKDYENKSIIVKKDKNQEDAAVVAAITATIIEFRKNS
jgi:oxaloacetate decarboxylase gamma subunit